MAGQNDPNQSKNDYAILWIIGLIIGVGALIYYFLGNHLKLGFLYLRKYEAIAANLIVKDPELPRYVNYYDGIIHSADPLSMASTLTLNQIIDYSNLVGFYYMFVVVAIILVMCLYLWKSHTSMRWNTKHNMDTLVRQEQNNWPQISPVVPIDLVDQNINEGPWAMAKNPMQFVRANKIIEVKKSTDNKSVWKAEDKYEAVLQKEKAYSVFARQMGPLWQGVNRLPPHTKALFAIFAARCEHKADEAREYLGELAQDAAKGEMKYTRTDEFLKKYGNNKAVQKCTQRHAYVLTLMASMLELARTDGVFASADFLWLKPVDRHLWYILNTVGRQTAPAEIAGPWAHWLAEKEMHRALSVPMVECAVDALELALAQMVYIPDDDVDEFPSETPEEV